MASEPTTPVRVPKAASTYTPSTQDPELRSQINSILLRDGHINNIQDTLLHTLHTSPTNWPTAIQSHALSLLRSGTCTTFPTLLARVLEDVRADSIAARHNDYLAKHNPNPSPTKNGNHNHKTQKDGGDDGVGNLKGKGRGENGASLALPKSVVDEGVRITRECLELVCEMD